MRTEDDLIEAERFAVASKESTTNNRVHDYAEGVRDALQWARGDEDEIPLIDYQTESAPASKIGHIEWWDRGVDNERWMYHVGCEDGMGPWCVPHDGMMAPKERTMECLHCCLIVPLQPATYDHLPASLKS